MDATKCCIKQHFHCHPWQNLGFDLNLFGNMCQKSIMDIVTITEDFDKLRFHAKDSSHFARKVDFTSQKHYKDLFYLKKNFIKQLG
jgi:hypothetical protein